MNRYLITGIPHWEDSGTGDLVRYLMPAARERGFTLVEQGPFLQGTPQMDAPAALKDVVSTFSKDGFERVLRSIRDAEIVLFHPQHLGFQNFLRLIENNRKVGVFVLDASFFCIQSYNHREGRVGECFDCLGDVSKCAAECRPMPSHYSREENLRYLGLFKELSDCVEFFVQCPSYGGLLERHFGPKVRWHLVGMRVPGVLERLDEAFLPGSGGYDVVYHASSLPAKGVRFALELARRLRHRSFLFPDSRSTVRQSAPDAAIGGNITFKPLRWNAGLREEVERCGLVLCPSLWSASIEGALIKSIAHNGNVAVAASTFGFEQELPSAGILRLPLEMDEAARLLDGFLERKGDMRSVSRPWLKEYMRSHDPSRLFDWFGEEEPLPSSSGPAHDFVPEMLSIQKSTETALAQLMVKLVKGLPGFYAEDRWVALAVRVLRPARRAYRLARNFLRLFGIKRRRVQEK